MKKGERTRVSIIHAAARLFEQQGYFSTGIDDIARSLHIAKGTMYQYFRDKRELFRVIVQDAVEELTARYDRLGTETDNLHDLVVGLFYQISIFYIRDYDFFTIHLSAGSSLWDSVDESFSPMRVLTTKIGEKLDIYRDEIDSDIAEAAVTLTMLTNACRICLMEVQQTPREQLTEEEIRKVSVEFAMRFLRGYAKKANRDF